MQRLVNRTRSLSSMMQATTEVLIDCFLKSITVARHVACGVRREKLSAPRAFRYVLLVCLPLHRGNSQPQGIELDETLRIGLIVNFIRFEGGEIDIEEAVGV